MNRSLLKKTRNTRRWSYCRWKIVLFGLFRCINPIGRVVNGIIAPFEAHMARNGKRFSIVGVNEAPLDGGREAHSISSLEGITAVIGAADRRKVGAVEIE